MKIKTLSIRNIASIESADLDFAGGVLGEAPLFLICGDTGSGKTTILDCITLALYGATPRYEKKGEHNPQEIGGYAYNDVRQLVRRGANSASATATLVGNDGKTYEARWSVDAVSRGPNKGTLNGAKWSWRDCSAGGLTQTGATECKAVAKRVVGLDFAQFCRTTMLAQGQFTKFLLGSPDEKAEILEKLTDTSKYSRLGMAISEKYNRLKVAKESIDDQIDLIPGLGEQRGQVEARIKELSAMSEGLGARSASVNARLQWLVQGEKLDRSAAGVKSEIAVAFAGLKALGENTAAETRAAKEDLESLKSSLARDESNAAMYDAANVILANLGDVRDARGKKAKGEAELARQRGLMPSHEEKVAAAKKALEDVKLRIATEEKKANAEEQALEKLDRRRVQGERDKAEKQRGDLVGLEGELRGIALQQRALSARKTAVAERKKALADRKASLPALKEAMDAAAAAFEDAKKSRDEQKKLIDDGIDKLVADLHVGDVCPVCGNVIEKIQTESHFRSLFESLDAQCREASADAKKKEKAYNVEAAAVEEIKASVASETRLIKAEEANIAQRIAEAGEKAKSHGVQDGGAGGIRAAIAACEGRIAELDKALAEIDKQDKKVKDLKKGIRKLLAAKDDAQDGFSSCEGAQKKLQSRIELLENSVKAEDERARAKLAEASSRISAKGWIAKWEASPDDEEDVLRREAGDYLTRKARCPKAEARLDALERSGRQVEDCVARAVARLGTISGIEAGGEAAESTAEMEGLLGQLDACEKALKDHADSRPKDIEEADTAEGLAEELAKLKEKLDNCNKEIGGCRQQVADDDKRAAERQAKEVQRAKLEAELAEWKSICDLFGDAEGKKIRREIQSYVLTNVLVKANHYLRQLSDRYELSCGGLTLSVLDSFEGGVARPVNTLSGGEQFLVSLALALGLAGMGETGLAVDMLLIDEGFGTLSGEHLDSAIEVLERLNSLTGSRKVGVISHVARLRERIPAHIEVTRSGHDPSRVAVVRSQGLRPPCAIGADLR